MLRALAAIVGQLVQMGAALRQRSFRKSGKYCGSCIVVNMPL